MARRRNVAGAIGASLMNVGDAIFRMMMQERANANILDRQAKAAEAIDERQAGAKRRENVMNIINRLGKFGVAEDGLDPEQAANMIALETGQAPDAGALTPLMPSARRRMEGMGKQIDTAKDLPSVPSDEAIISESRSKLVPELAASMLVPDALTDLGDPNALLSGVTKDTMERAGARRKAFREEPTEKVTVTNPDMSETTSFMSKYGAPVQTKPDAATMGRGKGTESVAQQTTELGNDQLTTLKGQTEGRIAALKEALTRQAKVDTAAAVAGATKRAELAPDIVEAEVEKAQKLQEGKDNSTESERRAATNWTPLVNAHTNAMGFESKGERIGTGDFTMTEHGITNWAVPAQRRNYLQAARDFVSTLGLIRSGVTVRPDERDALVASMFGIEGDTPQNLQQKQQSREVFLASMQAMVGRSADEAGRIMAEAINRGQISPNVLTTLTFEPKVQQALSKYLTGVPKFDPSGKPVQ